MIFEDYRSTVHNSQNMEKKKKPTTINLQINKE